MVAHERGQAAVESALVMPLMVFATLGIVQITMIQQARLMTEYAAFQAARAGTVWSGNVERMHDAAVIALLPTMGRTDTMEHVGETFDKHARYHDALAALSWSGTPATLNGLKLRGQIRIDTVNPSPLYGNDFSLWKLASGGRWEEIDFDGVDTFPEHPALESHLSKLYNLTPDADEDAYRKDTLLQIRLRYWYELRIPFANQVIFLAWYAANADVALSGAIDRSTTVRQNLLGKSGDVGALRGAGRGIGMGLERGYAPVTPSEMHVLWDLATGLDFLGGDRHFFVPLNATHSMRMQSNFHFKWLMHR